MITIESWLSTLIRNMHAQETWVYFYTPASNIGMISLGDESMLRLDAPGMTLSNLCFAMKL